MMMIRTKKRRTQGRRYKQTSDIPNDDDTHKQTTHTATQLLPAHILNREVDWASGGQSIVRYGLRMSLAFHSESVLVLERWNWPYKRCFGDSVCRISAHH